MRQSLQKCTVIVMCVARSPDPKINEPRTAPRPCMAPGVYPSSDVCRRDFLRLVVARRQFSEFATQSELEYNFPSVVRPCWAQPVDYFPGTGNASQLLLNSEGAHR